MSGTGLDPAQAVVQALDLDRLIDDLVSLVRIPSVSGTEDEVTVQEWYAEQLADAGLQVDLGTSTSLTLLLDPTFPAWRCGVTEPWAALVAPVRDCLG